jgi:hypothetical protein
MGYGLHGKHGIMKTIAALMVAGLLAGCAVAPGPGYAGPGYPEPVGYDAYYDDYYGPFYDGYWGGDGEFYYRDHEGHPWEHAVGGHFRHDGGPGFHPVHGFGGGFHGGGGGFHGGGGGHDEGGHH